MHAAKEFFPMVFYEQANSLVTLGGFNGELETNYQN